MYRCVFRPLAAVIVVAGLSIALPALAAGIDPVEAQITALHKKLQITAAEEPQWTDLAQVMRDNAKSHEDMVAEKRKTETTMNASEDLHAYAQLEQARAEHLEKLAESFDKLYAVMSDPQKKVADTYFRQHKRRARQTLQGKPAVAAPSH
jgi:isopropylmalate/homocitrate/citramalate synthase